VIQTQAEDLISGRECQSEVAMKMHNVNAVCTAAYTRSAPMAWVCWSGTP